MSGVGFTDFYDAGTARQIAMGGAAPLGEILTEINAIKEAIETAVAANTLTATITNSTAMTQSATYFEAWSDVTQYQTDAHKLARSRMDAVIHYFARLGYAVRREREGTQNRLQWVIKW